MTLPDLPDPEPIAPSGSPHRPDGPARPEGLFHPDGLSHPESPSHPDGLSHPDKDARIEAAVRLGSAADPASLPALVGALATDPDFFVAESVTWALVRIGPAAVEPLVALLGTGTGPARARAAHALSKLADSRAVPALAAALADPDPVVVEKSVLALRRIGGDEALAALVSLLDHAGRRPELAAALADALESFGSRALPVLSARAGDPDPAVRAQVVDLLGFSGGADAVPQLCAAVEDAEPAVRIRALAALAGVRRGLRVRPPGPRHPSGRSCRVGDPDRRPHEGAVHHEDRAHHEDRVHREVALAFERARRDPDRQVRLLAERLAGQA